MTYDEIVKKIAGELGLTPTFVNKTYRAFWKSVKKHMEEQPLMNDLTDEEFTKLRPNVNVPSLGKFYVTLDNYKIQKKVYRKRLTRREQRKQKEQEEQEKQNN